MTQAWLICLTVISFNIYMVYSYLQGREYAYVSDDMYGCAV